jgi:hypothetical protein
MDIDLFPLIDPFIIDENMICFHFFAILNNAGVNICVQALCKHTFISFPSLKCVYLRVGLLSHMIPLNLLRNLVWSVF